MADYTLNFNKQAFISRSEMVSTERSLQQAIRRLTSGKKFNAPSDGPASFSVLSRMSTDLSVGEQGVTNGKNGTSLLSTADAALANIEKTLTSIAVLAEDSANGVWSDEQRAVFDQQAQSLIKVIDDISQATEFNGKKVLDGGMSKGLTLQLGGQNKAHDQVILKISQMDTKVLFTNLPMTGGKAITLTGQQSSLGSLSNVNIALSHVRRQRAEIGASQQAIEVNISNRESMNEETKNTISNIGDADVAQEMENFTNYTAKSQAASYMYTIAMQYPARIAQMIQSI